jgi:hypothetical protein
MKPRLPAQVAALGGKMIDQTHSPLFPRLSPETLQTLLQPPTKGKNMGRN